MQRRQEILNDITDTVGSVFTGLTYGCARCHNHKYDPISQADYYRLQAFFANVRAADDIIVASSKRREQHQKKMSMWEEKTCEIRKAMAAIEEPKRKEIADDNYAKFPPEVQAAISRPGPERTPIEWQMYYKALPYLNPDHQSIVGSLSGEAKKRWETLKVDLNKFSDLYPGELPVGIGICDLSREAPKTFLLSGGVYSAPKEEVEPGFLSIVDPSQPRIVPVAAISSTGRRTALSSWLVQAENPLTSRVMVNRSWHHHFGRGIVGTPSDFGAMGEPPSHRGLLD